MKKFLKENVSYMLIFIALFILTIFIFFSQIYSNGIAESNFEIDTILKLTAFLIVVSIIYFFILKNIDIKQIKLENVFLFLIIPIGLIYLFIFPPNTIPDEANHFEKSYDISLGHLVSKFSDEGLVGNELPNNLLDFCYSFEKDNYGIWLERAKASTISNDMQWYSFPNTSLYSFICYLPQAIGIFVARIFTNKWLIIFLFSRLFNFAVYVALMYFSIKIMPFNKNLLVLIASLPIVLQEAISISPDATTIALCVFLVSYIFYLKDKKIVLTKKNYFILAIFSILIALMKIVYTPICLLMYILPKEQFTSKKKKYLLITSFVLLALLINLLWTGYASRFLVETNVGVNSKEQVKFVLMHPLNFILTIFRTMNMYLANWISNILGDLSYYKGVSVASIYKYITAFLLIIFMFCDNKKEEKIEKNSKIFIGIIFLLIIGLIFSSLYVQWTALQRENIEGVQGRYFIPIIMLIPLLFKNDYFTLEKKIQNRILVSFLLFLNLHAIISIIPHFLVFIQ